MQEIMRGRPTFEEPEWAHVSITTKDMAKRLLVVHPECRLTAAEALAHPFVDNCHTVGNDVELPSAILQSLQNFARVDPFKKAALYAVAQHLNTPQIGHLHE